MQVVDYSYSHPSPAEVRSLGYVGAMRYLGNDNPPQPRVITPAEIDALTANGLDYGLVWETTASRAGDGYAAGVQDAQRANGMADVLGFPKDRPIYFAVDFQATAAQVAQYFQGVLSVHGRPEGIYGHYDLIETFVGGGTLPYGWQCAAWSGNGTGSGGSIQGRRVSRHACLFQKVGYVVHGTCDENEVLKPDWGQAHYSTPAPAPKPPENEMLYAKSINSDDVYVLVPRDTDAGPEQKQWYWKHVPKPVMVKGTVVSVPTEGSADVDEVWGFYDRIGGSQARVVNP